MPFAKMKKRGRRAALGDEDKTIGSINHLVDPVDPVFVESCHGVLHRGENEKDEEIFKILLMTLTRLQIDCEY